MQIVFYSLLLKLASNKASGFNYIIQELPMYPTSNSVPTLFEHTK
jgi:hypothetical protein